MSQFDSNLKKLMIFDAVREKKKIKRKRRKETMKERGKRVI